MASGSYSATIMLSVIISLVLVVLFYIIAGWVYRCRARRRAGTDQLSTRIEAMQVQSSETPRKGLHPSIIAALPIFVFKYLSHNGTRDCAICLSAIEEEEMAMLLPNCKHMFHAQCINTWLNSHTTCPICRSGVEPQAMPENIEASVAVTFAAPVTDPINSTTSGSGDASDAAAESSKVGELRNITLSSFCWIGTLTGERSGRRIQPCGQTDELEDLESH